MKKGQIKITKPKKIKEEKKQENNDTFQISSNNKDNNENKNKWCECLKKLKIF